MARSYLLVPPELYNMRLQQQQQSDSVTDVAKQRLYDLLHRSDLSDSERNLLYSQVLPGYLKHLKTSAETPLRVSLIDQKTGNEQEMPVINNQIVAATANPSETPVEAPVAPAALPPSAPTAPAGDTVVSSKQAEYERLLAAINVDPSRFGIETDGKIKKADGHDHFQGSHVSKALKQITGVEKFARGAAGADALKGRLKKEGLLGSPSARRSQSPSKKKKTAPFRPAAWPK